MCYKEESAEDVWPNAASVVSIYDCLRYTADKQEDKPSKVETEDNRVSFFRFRQQKHGTEDDKRHSDAEAKDNQCGTVGEEVMVYLG